LKWVWSYRQQGSTHRLNQRWYSWIDCSVFPGVCCIWLPNSIWVIQYPVMDSFLHGGLDLYNLEHWWFTVLYFLLKLLSFGPARRNEEPSMSSILKPKNHGRIVVGTDLFLCAVPHRTKGVECIPLPEPS
jgi:hypothetical protein